MEAYKWCILQVLNEKELFVFYLILKSLTKMRKIYALMVLLFAVMYFILIRPQKKKEKEQQAMQRAVRVGDEIVTIGGIVGLVTRVEDDTIQIETGGDRHKMRIKTWAIQENITVKEDNERAKAAAAEEAKAKKESKKKKKDDEESVLKD